MMICLDQYISSNDYKAYCLASVQMLSISQTYLRFQCKIDMLKPEGGVETHTATNGLNSTSNLEKYSNEHVKHSIW